jgi:hypothetical protein
MFGYNFKGKEGFGLGMKEDIFIPGSIYQTPQSITYKIESTGSSRKNTLEDMWCLVFNLNNVKSCGFLELD